MTAIPFYQIDAFASRPFEGNQACVMPLEDFLPDETLQAIAAENNVAETAFIVEKNPGKFALRWFTPAVEVPLCGHATLASAHAIYTHIGFNGEEIAFETVQSGVLKVRRLADETYEMDFPAPKVEKIAVTEDVAAAPVQPLEQGRHQTHFFFHANGRGPAVQPQRHGRADGRMPRKWQFLIGRKDAQGRTVALVLRFADEHGFAEVELAGDRLHLIVH